MSSNVTIVGDVNYREGDGPTMQIICGLYEIEESATDVMLGSRDGKTVSLRCCRAKSLNVWSESAPYATIRCPEPSERAESFQSDVKSQPGFASYIERSLRSTKDSTVSPRTASLMPIEMLTRSPGAVASQSQAFSEAWIL